MPNVDTDHQGEGATHFACEKQMMRYGRNTPCCHCTSHQCREPIGPIIKGIAFELADEARECFKGACTMIAEFINKKD